MKFPNVYHHVEGHVCEAVVTFSTVIVVSSHKIVAQRSLAPWEPPKKPPTASKDPTGLGKERLVETCGVKKNTLTDVCAYQCWTREGVDVATGSHARARAARPATAKLVPPGIYRRV